MTRNTLTTLLAITFAGGCAVGSPTADTAEVDEWVDSDPSTDDSGSGNTDDTSGGNDDTSGTDDTNGGDDSGTTDAECVGYYRVAPGYTLPGSIEAELASMGLTAHGYGDSSPCEGEGLRLALCRMSPDYTHPADIQDPAGFWTWADQVVFVDDEGNLFGGVYSEYSDSIDREACDGFDLSIR